MEGLAVLVTGASSGIGAGVAAHLASLGCRCGHTCHLPLLSTPSSPYFGPCCPPPQAPPPLPPPRLCLVGRTTSALEEVAASCRQAGSPEVATLTLDLALEGAPGEAVRGAVAALGGLDVLVNSAGILMSGSIETLGVHDYDKVISFPTRVAE